MAVGDRVALANAIVQSLDDPLIQSSYEVGQKSGPSSVLPIGTLKCWGSEG